MDAESDAWLKDLNFNANAFNKLQIHLKKKLLT